MSPARRYLSALRRGNPASWLALVAVLGVVGVVAALWQHRSGFESTDDAFVEGTLSHLASEIPGRVVEVPIDEHAVVSAGDLLVRLDASGATARLARARADLAAAHNQMNSAEAAAAASDAERRAAQVEAWRSGREYERVQQLARSGAANTQQLDTARAEHDAAEARVVALELRAKAERGVLGNEAPLRQAEAALREAEIDLEHCELRAPFDAVVGRKNVHLGDSVRAGQALMALRRREPSWIVANFKETQLRRMQPGSPVTVHVDAYPSYTWWGHVDSFSPASGAKYALIPPEPAAGNFTKVVQRVPVKIVLDEVANGDGQRVPTDSASGPELAIGLSAQVSVDVR